MKKGLVLLLIGLFSAVSAHAEYILWFSILDDAQVETLTGSMTLAAFAAETGANAARLLVKPSGPYLDLYYEDEGIWVTEPGLNIADNGDTFDNGSTLDWQPAGIGSYADPGYVFVLELGRIGNDDIFRSLASAEGSYADLLRDGHISTGGISTQAQTPWAPNFTAVPEPGSGALALFGALLLMRRRHAESDTTKEAEDRPHT